jgi:hypothetical protein
MPLILEIKTSYLGENRDLGLISLGILYHQELLKDKSLGSDYTQTFSKIQIETKA